MALLGCSAFGPNLSYQYPEGCEGIGVINNLEEGTDLSTQFTIVLTGIQVPEVRGDLIKAFQDFIEILEIGNQSDISNTIDLTMYLSSMVTDINANYGTVVAMLSPALNNLLQQEEFTKEIPLGRCDFDRLKFWAESNIRNLETLK